MRDTPTPSEEGSAVARGPPLPPHWAAGPHKRGRPGQAFPAQWEALAPMRRSAQGRPSPGASAGHRTLVACCHSSKARPEAEARETAHVSAAPEQPNHHEGCWTKSTQQHGRQALGDRRQGRAVPVGWPTVMAPGQAPRPSPHPPPPLSLETYAALSLTSFPCPHVPAWSLECPIYTAGPHSLLHLIVRPPLCPGPSGRPWPASLPGAPCCCSHCCPEHFATWLLPSLLPPRPLPSALMRPAPSPAQAS